LGTGFGDDQAVAEPQLVPTEAGTSDFEAMGFRGMWSMLLLQAVRPSEADRELEKYVDLPICNPGGLRNISCKLIAKPLWSKFCQMLFFNR